ncbi:hypothetical protein [Streptomyces sp. CA-251247]|uniref:hypothetical protein n=1 Tax=Streptomyces sp. CA-251247 TaxID=3240062 RepID=UPI003D8C89B8
MPTNVRPPIVRPLVHRRVRPLVRRRGGPLVRAAAALMAPAIGLAAYMLQPGAPDDRLAGALANSPLPRAQLLVIDPPGGFETEPGSGRLDADFRLHYSAGGRPGSVPGFDYEVTVRPDAGCPEELPGQIVCLDAGDGFTVVKQRHVDGTVSHYVVQRRGTLLLRARTAPGLDVERLRSTLAAARPATDEELVRALPGR